MPNDKYSASSYLVEFHFRRPTGETNMRVHTGLRCVTCLNTIIHVCQDLDLPLRPLAVSILSYSGGHVCL